MTTSTSESSPLHESALLKELGGVALPQAWAKSVQLLSNHYVSEPDSISPWHQPWAREALLSYFHPLNQSRAWRVATKGAELGFFDGLTRLIDLGCGSAAAAMGFLEVHRFTSVELIDHSQDITMLAKRLVEQAVPEVKVHASQQSLELFKSPALSADAAEPAMNEKTILLLSYVLTEAHSAAALERLLLRNPRLEAIAILEPSTAEDARRLQAMRPLLIKHGYNLWAPCTHEKECPLLKDSDRDWCHDRLIPKLPGWWREMEAGLPMKNKTVTVSYLLARKQPRPRLNEQVRVIGDRLDEKTKVRQMICRHDEREFLSWFPSRLKGDALDFHLKRGDLFDSDEVLWKDPRGIDRSREWRIDLAGVGQISSTLVTSQDE